MKKTYCLIFLILLVFLFNTSPVLADTISPFKNAVDIRISESSLEYLSFTNDSDETEEILLTVYGYDTQKEEISNDVPPFLRVDTDTFEISKGETQDIPYEVVIPANTEIGTYFNLLVLEPVPNTGNSVVNTINSLSQVVEINVYEEDNTEYTLPESTGNISIEVTNKGIPLIKGAIITYTYTNTTNYLLQPEGELQIFNEKQNTEPIYIKINEKEKYLHAGETLTETFILNNYTWSLDDLIYDRIILGRFYNGLDGSYQAEKITIESFKDEILIGGIVVLFVFILTTESSKAKGRKLSTDYEDESEEEE